MLQMPLPTVLGDNDWEGLPCRTHPYSAPYRSKSIALKDPWDTLVQKLLVFDMRHPYRQTSQSPPFIYSQSLPMLRISSFGIYTSRYMICIVLYSFYDRQIVLVSPVIVSRV